MFRFSYWSVEIVKIILMGRSLTVVILCGSITKQ